MDNRLPSQGHPDTFVKSPDSHSIANLPSQRCLDGSGALDYPKDVQFSFGLFPHCPKAVRVALGCPIAVQLALRYQIAESNRAGLLEGSDLLSQSHPDCFGLPKNHLDGYGLSKSCPGACEATRWMMTHSNDSDGLIGQSWCLTNETPMRLHWYWNLKIFLVCIPIKAVQRLSTLSYVSRSMEETWYIWFSNLLQSFDLKLVKNEYLNSPKFHKGSVQTSFTLILSFTLFSPCPSHPSGRHGPTVG